MGRMKDHERDFLAGCGLDPESDDEEVSRSLAVYRGSGLWQRVELGLALEKLYAAVADALEPLLTKLARLGRLVQRG